MGRDLIMGEKASCLGASVLKRGSRMNEVLVVDSTEEPRVGAKRRERGSMRCIVNHEVLFFVYEVAIDGAEPVPIG